MQILITGGGGYVGSILSKKLLDKGHHVRVIDTLWYGKETLNESIKSKKFELVEADIRNLMQTVKAMEGVDTVIHLASIVGMPASNIEPRTSEEINYLATKNIAELCQLHNIETYIFASTCSVYGSQPNKLITEKLHIDGNTPIDYYAKQKWLSERAINWLNAAPTIFRFGTLFGYSPRMRFDLVVNLFIGKAIQEGKITVFGGEQYRPFLHVADAADSLIFGLENDLTGTYNVVNQNFSIMDIAKIIQKITGCEIELSNENEDQRNYRVSGKKLSRMGFVPEKTIEFAFNEIKTAIEEGKIGKYSESKYNNFKTLTESKKMQKSVFIYGLDH